VHYAVKANANPKVLGIISQAGLGADCVSGGEIRAALSAGFPASKIVYAGVGKSDWEINLGLDANIFCFNVESIPELEIINELAAREGKIARVCLRINPDVKAHTHTHIITGMAENKFGIALKDMLQVVQLAQRLDNVSFEGLHFHIGSQITNMQDYVALCQRINEIQHQLMVLQLLDLYARFLFLF
jgi:diaminopimelate decarboxylase